MSFLANLSDSEDDNNDSSLFSHSARNFSSIVAEQVRRDSAKKESSRPIQQNAEPKKSRKRKSKDISHSDDEDHEAAALPTTETPAVGSRDAVKPSSIIVNDDITSREQREPQAVTATVPAQQILPAHATPRPESSTTLQPNIATPNTPAAVAEEDSPDEDSDDEFAEVARQARRQMRQRKLEQMTNRESKADTQSTHQSLSEPEPKVEILISSQLENTAPLRVFLRLSQRLGMVRSAWCQRQNFPEGFDQQVYLVYRGRKVYDVSTCRSLGLEIDGYGQLILRGAEGKQGIDRVHLEAWTDDLLEKERREEEEAQQKVEAKYSAIAEYNARNPQTDEGEESLIPVILKSQSQADYKVKVRPSTTITKIMAGYRKRYSIDSATAIVLKFDGEELSPDQLVSDTEISTMDQIEVHFR